MGGRCGPGHDCPQGSRLKRDCPGGFYCVDGTGVTGLCKAGYWCERNSYAATPDRVVDEFGVLVADECPAGHYCEEGVAQAEPCPPGVLCFLLLFLEVSKLLRVRASYDVRRRFLLESNFPLCVIAKVVVVQRLIGLSRQANSQGRQGTQMRAAAPYALAAGCAQKMQRPSSRKGARSDIIALLEQLTRPSSALLGSTALLASPSHRHVFLGRSTKTQGDRIAPYAQSAISASSPPKRLYRAQWACTAQTAQNLQINIRAPADLSTTALAWPLRLNVRRAVRGTTAKQLGSQHPQGLAQRDSTALLAL